MKQLISWLIRNRKTVITAAGLAWEYGPKAYRFVKAKVQRFKAKGKGQKEKVEGKK